MLKINKQQIGFILLLVFLITFTAGLYPAAGIPPDSPVSDLRKQENEILAELITLDLKIENGLKGKAALEQKLAANEKKVAQAEAELGQIKKDLRQQTRKLGQMASFIYRLGYVSFLEVFLTSTDFDDFASRLFLITAIMDRYAQIRGQTETLKNKTEDKIDLINKINNLIVVDRNKVLDTIARLERTKTERSNFLAQIKEQSSELEARITLSADRWFETNSTITGILDRLSSLPPEKFMPDRVSLSLNGMQVEFSENTLNKTISHIGNKTGKPVNLNVEPDLISMSGTLNTGTNFVITGVFEVAQGGGEILFVPRTFTFGNTNIQGAALDYIYSNKLLKWDITRNLPGFKAVRLSTGKDKFVVTLTKT